MSIKNLFLNNFRGFYNTEVPISDINFLVGENSTGKTSILKLIDLISAQEFWLAGVFRKTDVDFSYFGDIHTKSDTSNRSLVGIEFVTNEKKEIRILFELDEDINHSTRIKAIKVNSVDFDIQILIDEQLEISYKIIKRKSKLTKSFSTWCKKWNEHSDAVKIDDRNRRSYYGKSPYFIISEVIGSISVEKNNRYDSNFIPLDLIMDDYKWIAPIRVKPQKTYDESVYDYSSDGSHAPYLLKRIMSNVRSKKSQQVISALRKFGKEGNLFDDLKVKEFSDEGNSPFSIELFFNNQSRQITNVGYGVSQVLPIVVEILNSGQGKFAIQQPEVHLHPRAQASFGGFIYDAALIKSKFVIETHSDFVVDRFRQQVASKKLESTSQVIFFERTKDRNKITSIPILENGQYSDNQPKNFREFFYNEALKNLGI